MKPVTVPAWVLAALGGLHDDDPPVLLAGGGVAIRPWHRCCGGPRKDSQILLPQSAPALLRVLARHFGLPPSAYASPHWGASASDWEDPMHHGLVWQLGTIGRVATGRTWQHWAPPSARVREPVRRDLRAPVRRLDALEGIEPYQWERALAAVVLHEAERARRGGDDDRAPSPGQASAAPGPPGPVTDEEASGPCET